MVTTITNLERTVKNLFQSESSLAPDLVSLFFKRHHCERKYSREEALCDAYLGAWKAAQNYDPTRGKTFRSWAWLKINYELKAGLRRNRISEEQCFTDVEHVREHDPRMRDKEELISELARTDSIETVILKDVIATLMHRLSPEQRALVYKHYVLRESATTLAQQRGTTKRAIFYRLKTIRKKLQAYDV